MNKLQVWTCAIRPKTFIASISPALIGASLAISEAKFDLYLWLLTLLTGLLIQVGTNLANDYFDFIKGADTKERKGFLRVTQAGLVSHKEIKWAMTLAFSAAFFSGCYLIFCGGPFIGVMLALYILLSVLYTAGPFPLAYLGLGDILVLLLYGPVAVLITYYLQTEILSKEAFLAGLCPGALSMAILVINNVRDREEDKAANKKTLPVRFGKVFGKSQFVFSILLCFVPLLFFYKTHPFSLLTLLTLLPAVKVIKEMILNEQPLELNRLFGKTGQLLWLFTLLFCIGWIL